MDARPSQMRATRSGGTVVESLNGREPRSDRPFVVQVGSLR
jgi:hypothetical protein